MSNAAPRFSSRFTFLISALGIAIGTGNIWRFPRIVATNGGENGAGSFLVAWIMFLFCNLHTDFQCSTCSRHEHHRHLEPQGVPPVY